MDGTQSGPQTDTLAAGETAAAAVATAPRVTLADIEAAIAERYDIGAYKACQLSSDVLCVPDDALKVLSIGVPVLRNGYTVVGKSAPASPENFDAALGKQLAYDDARRQLWPLMGFALRQQLYGAKVEADVVKDLAKAEQPAVPPVPAPTVEPPPPSQEDTQRALYLHLANLERETVASFAGFLEQLGGALHLPEQADQSRLAAVASGLELVQFLDGIIANMKAA